ncbi:MAG TPA: hypothetical protein VK735_46600 [Pseudonocardia sp.]|uniref:hypothetical protein n=1 Tax=Pseudonocardia sp. TaxID=60912 RepID=UPI002C0726A8|nr:hypothetical protein [Pseudonocardia sp.]HTF54962.1 hypothetical protein [Pseudonocardia sp.]
MRDRIRRIGVTPMGVAVVGGALWWAIGSLAFPSGIGTLVLAFGLLVAGGLYRAARRRPDARVPSPASARGRLRRLVLLGGLLVVAAVLALGGLGYSELTSPVACMIVGGCLVPAAALLDRSGCVPLGAALMVLGACGALLALRSVGELYPMGLVGLGAGALLWAAAAVEVGLHLELRTKIGSR